MHRTWYHCFVLVTDDDSDYFPFSASSCHTHTILLFLLHHQLQALQYLFTRAYMLWWRGQSFLTARVVFLEFSCTLQWPKKLFIKSCFVAWLSASPYLYRSTYWNGVTSAVGSSIMSNGTIYMTPFWCSLQTQVGHSSLGDTWYRFRGLDWGIRRGLWVMMCALRDSWTDCVMY